MQNGQISIIQDGRKIGKLGPISRSRCGSKPHLPADRQHIPSQTQGRCGLKPHITANRQHISSQTQGRCGLKPHITANRQHIPSQTQGRCGLKPHLLSQIQGRCGLKPHITVDRQHISSQTQGRCGLKPHLLSQIQGRCGLKPHITANRWFPICSLTLRIINTELTALITQITPPPPLNIQKVLYFTRWYRLQGHSIFATPAHAPFRTECFVAGYFFYRTAPTKGLRKPCTTKWRLITRCQ